MPISSINPYTGQCLETFEVWNAARCEAALARAHQAGVSWAALAPMARADLLQRVAQVLREQRTALADCITREMGKLQHEALAEIEKCAWTCDYYAEHGPHALQAMPITAAPAQSYVSYSPLGCVLAVMPWNFPFWQVFRCAAPILMAGNVMLLKHASNVTRCALEIERVFIEAGFPEGVMQTLIAQSDQIPALIADARVHGVTLTGSERAGRAVASCAGQHLKKAVLELGGSDPFVVLEDAPLEAAVAAAIASRYQNAGQSCVAAKRFIVLDAIADEFVARLVAAAAQLTGGDPAFETTRLAPLARADIHAEVCAQVAKAVEQGACLVLGGVPSSKLFYPATVLDAVSPTMSIWHEEVFGPVALVTRVCDEAAALVAANDTLFGLGGSVWTQDMTRGERFIAQVNAGVLAVNAVVKSDPRLPFGGIKHSGYGRELGEWGLHEFVNIKAVTLG